MKDQGDRSDGMEPKEFDVFLKKMVKLYGNEEVPEPFTEKLMDRLKGGALSKPFQVPPLIGKKGKWLILFILTIGFSASFFMESGGQSPILPKLDLSFLYQWNNLVDISQGLALAIASIVAGIYSLFIIDRLLKRFMFHKTHQAD